MNIPILVKLFDDAVDENVKVAAEYAADKNSARDVLFYCYVNEVAITPFINYDNQFTLRVLMESYHRRYWYLMYKDINLDQSL